MKNNLITRLYIIGLICIIALGLLSVKSYATGTFSVSPSSTAIKVGSTANITIAANSCGGKFTITSSDASIVTVSASEKWIEQSSDTVTLTGKKAGTAKVTITASEVAGTDETDVTGSKTVTVTVTESNNTEDKTTTTSEPNFNSVNQTVYAVNDTNIRASYSTSSQSYGKLAKGESVTRTGIGDNGWSKVNYNGKTAYIYTANLTTTKPAEEAVSTVKTLKSLTIAEGTLEPAFDPETTKYSTSIGNSIEKLTLEALLTDEKATVTVTGNEKFVTGSNTVKITVKAEDGTTRIYNIEVVKSQKDQIALSTLNIPGITLNPTFDPLVYEYKVDLDNTSTVSDLGIEAKSNREDTTIEIIGNENFKVGENIITILISSTDGTEKVSYQIIVNKPEQAQSPSILGGNNSTTNIILVIIGILGVVAIVIIIVTVIRKKKAKEQRLPNDFDKYPLSKEQENLNTNEEEEREDYTGLYRTQISEQDENETQNQNQLDDEDDDLEQNNEDINNKNNIPNTKYENNNSSDMEMTRRFTTEYDYTMETFRKQKENKTKGKGKHF